ncbi:hypothetical protein SAMN04488057_10525 [Cyclobacterium lianum]|uniref:Glycosyl-4,4'-diaponeurosporenoate acyltransferase n=1 Tax=Cyclobacterium lianum TaxID=388280 RepID=A0A1M7N2W0_9BACT|nr:hypothetical protein [Cyclobacterium lianum]SHM97844.1 hypothetical protein SAMN04488057_10525 [Cyclobacterium lianum]
MAVKKVVFPLFSIFLVYQSYELVNAILILEPSEVPLWMKILFAALLNLFVTGVFAFTGFAYKTSRLLPDKYYRIRDPEFLLEISGVLKLTYFRKFLLLIFWSQQKNRKKFFNGSIAGLENFDYQTRQSEFGHLIPMLLIQLLCLIILTQGHYAIALVATLLNICFNFYPVVLQRNHRMRISVLNHKLKNRESDS